jgi:hypothetical protein
MLSNPDSSVTAIAKLLGVSPGTSTTTSPTYASSAPPAEHAPNSRQREPRRTSSALSPFGWVMVTSGVCVAVVEVWTSLPRSGCVVI